MSQYIDRAEIFKTWRSDSAPATIESLTNAIFKTPGADVRPVIHGRWRFCGLGKYNDAYECSECGKIAIEDSNFCPYCGAEMKEE